jgi:Gas vesicle protein
MTSGGLPMSSRARPPERRQEASTNLADILERVLDKGIVIAGDIRVNLLDIELLTIKIRLLVASVDKAREMGIDWWEHDPTLSSGKSGGLAEENRLLRERVAALEAGSPEGLDGAAPAERPIAAPKDVAEPAPEVIDPAPEELVDEEPGDPEPEEAPEPAPARRSERRARRPAERRRRDDG